jgi:2-C-methyl-D-erythritol 4-phosphate cytidylyltransferase
VKLVAVVAGAGSGSRYGSDKLAESLGRRSILECSVDAISRACPAAPMVVVLPSSRMTFWQSILERARPGVVLVAGGPRRQDSVRNGVEAAVRLGADVVLIHDAARPLVQPIDVESAIAAIHDADAAILCGRVVDTVKRVDPDGRVVETLDRDRLRLAQTPQVFRVDALYQAWADCDDDRSWTDEASMVETIGLKVRTVIARGPNPKITVAVDLEVARGLMATP